MEVWLSLFCMFVLFCFVIVQHVASKIETSVVLGFSVVGSLSRLLPPARSIEGSIQGLSDPDFPRNSPPSCSGALEPGAQDKVKTLDPLGLQRLWPRPRTRA